MTNKNQYQPVVGMEIHVELKTVSKMFCSCKNDPFHAGKPNVNTCPVCLGMPGGLPVANKKAIEWTIQLGLALGCKINRFSKFDRKHYFYPDLAKGYQISQYDLPFAYGGRVETSFGPVGITRVHLEEDTGKLIHATVSGKKVSLVDFNRCGVPLVEIVTEPEIYSAAQAKECAKKLRQLVRYLDIADCDMEKGGMRLEANISLVKAEKPGRPEVLPAYKVELKNINSFRFLEKGIEYEVTRQSGILDRGETPVQETRGFSAEKGMTYSQRTKESAEDYRYFPDPDLPPVRIDDPWFGKIESCLPVSLEARLASWKKTYGINPEWGERLFETAGEADKYETVFQLAKKSGLAADKLSNFIVNKKIAVDINRDDPQKIVAEFKKTVTVSDVSDDALSVFIDKALAANPKAVTDYKSGKTAAINFLVGMVMREAKQKIEFTRLSALIVKKIK